MALTFPQCSHRRLLTLVLAALCLLLLGADAEKVTALGRLEPKDGVIRVAGPSHVAVVIAELLVAEGDTLERGALIARLDSHAKQRALVAGAEAELEDAMRELRRSAELQRGRAASEASREEAELRVRVARASLQAARAELALAEVHAPSRGQVLAIHARAGERVGPDGIIELGDTEEMYAVAEVYETDIGRVAMGQRATVTSSALRRPLVGTVARVGLMVAKMDVLGTDPIARTDARVVEVDIRLDPGQEVETLTYLQVMVEIDGAAPER